MSLTLIFSASTWPNIKSKVSFEILRTSRFKNWPYFLNLVKIWGSYCQKQNFQILRTTLYINVVVMLCVYLGLIQLIENLIASLLLDVLIKACWEIQLEVEEQLAGWAALMTGKTRKMKLVHIRRLSGKYILFDKVFIGLKLQTKLLQITNSRWYLTTVK